jgi:L-methionine (R)-S-oxide reductase
MAAITLDWRSTVIPQRAADPAATPATLYADLQRSIAGLLAGEDDLIANTANFAATVYHSLPDLNWAGWYFLRGEELVLGPFQGRPACVRIAMGRGVCGTAAQRRTSVLVPDVHLFPDHIVCDLASRSELVVPLIEGNRLIGVFDLDSPRPNRFGAADQSGIEAAVRLLGQKCCKAQP